jgi:hypothetical protein
MPAKARQERHHYRQSNRDAPLGSHRLQHA